MIPVVFLAACALSEAEDPVEVTMSPPVLASDDIQAPPPEPEQWYKEGSIEEQAIHLTAEFWKAPESSLSVRRGGSVRKFPGATHIHVSAASRPTDRPPPSHDGIVVDDVLHMGQEAATQAILSQWADTKYDAADLAWLANFGGSCDVTSGPTVPAIDALCTGHEPRLLRQSDGRKGVRYWVRCSGRMRPPTSQTIWEAWIQPDLTMEASRVAVCSAGSVRTRPQ